jgi:DNA-binding transcriptional LysR family regulator
MSGPVGVGGLFHRTTRRLSLTETGHAYYERARRILADVAEAETPKGWKSRSGWSPSPIS